MPKHKIIIIICIPFLLSLFGCNAQKDQMAMFDNMLVSSNLDQSACYAKSLIKSTRNPEAENLLWSLQVASIERLKADYTSSNKYFDDSEAMMKYFDNQDRTLDIVGSTLINDNALPYRGQTYDGIFVNTYKALNFMALGNNDLARVEFNRAIDRQRRATEKFSQEITKLKDKLAREKGQQAQLAQQSADSPQLQSILMQRYPNLYSYEIYPDFVNPFTNYIAGVFFNQIGEHDKALDLLKQAYGMVSKNDYLAAELKLTEDVLNGTAKYPDAVWVVFENGLGPIKKEMRIDLPLFIATNKVHYAGIALPELRVRYQAFSHLVVESQGQQYNTQTAANVDRIVQTEFKKDFDGILLRALVAATAKAMAQYAIQDQDSDNASLASIAVAIYGFATTAADVRIWSALPKEIQVAKVPVPADGMLKITPFGAYPIEINVPQNTSSLVNIRIINRNAPPVINVFEIK